MIARPRVTIDQTASDATCRRWGVHCLSLFGSVRRDDFGPGSDVDVLVEFDDAARVDVRFVVLAEELSLVFGGRRVDLDTPSFLGASIRGEVLAAARLACAA